MTTNNIELFDVLTGRVFAELYQHFPVAEHLESWSYRDLFTGTPIQDGWLAKEDAIFFQSTVEWLGSAGYIEHGNSLNNGDVQFCVLTAKGLEVLKAFPMSLQSGPTLGDKLVDASKGGAKEVLRGVASEALSLGARMLTTHLGLPS
ncbi:hypothetical protein LOY46_11315 [Pseudomonas sichuanensis]|uniref:hypothetical protein n=1 Tax=Pseudomonas sichuanensis TaxID=2213015 RepID=UPI00215F35A4|nr:hypothetical protein [Pseudomonas sichuanensis]UVK85233.1 hypothetical protein LOY46_11315 [Pseudomonas sichuanensis]